MQVVTKGIHAEMLFFCMCGGVDVSAFVDCCLEFIYSLSGAVFRQTPDVRE